MDKEIFYLPPNDPDMDRDYIKGSEYMDGTRTAIRTISTDFDTDVIFQGDGACTNGDFVILPTQDQDAMMTHRQVNVGRGYANHESLHKLLTDFKNGQAWLKRMHSSGRGFTAHMGQAIEDIRIENGGQHLYGGMAKSIDKTAEEVCRVFAKEHADEKILNDPWKMLPLAITWIGRIKLGYPSPVIQQAFDNLGEEVKKRATLASDAIINGIEHGVVGVGQVDTKKAYKGCRDGMALAEKLTEQLKAELPPEPEGGDGDEPTTTKEGDGTGNGTATGKTKDDDKDKDGNSTAKQEKTKHGDNDVNDPKDGGTKNDSDTVGHGATEITIEEAQDVEPTPIDHELSQVKELLSNHEESKGGRRGVHRIVHTPYSTSDDVIEPPKQASEHPSHYREEYFRAKRVLGSRLATMRRKLERALMAKVNVDRETSTSGRLNVRGKSSGIIMGADKIYTRKVEGQEIDTAVSLLIDCSGSMSGQPMELAGHSAIAMSEALEAGQVPYEVIGHTTISLSNTNRDAFRQECVVRDDDGNVISTTGYARECGLYMPVFKPFNKALRQCYPEMGCIPSADMSSNADACAIREAGNRLLQRREAKKVLLLLADGYPAWSTSFDRRQRDKYTRQAVINLENQGVTCVGIGIASDCVKQYFEKWVVINSVDDLSRTVLDQVAKLIIGDRFTVDNAELIGGKNGLRTKAS